MACDGTNVVTRSDLVNFTPGLVTTVYSLLAGVCHYQPGFSIQCFS